MEEMRSSSSLRLDLCKKGAPQAQPRSLPRNRPKTPRERGDPPTVRRWRERDWRNDPRVSTKERDVLAARAEKIPEEPEEQTLVPKKELACLQEGGETRPLFPIQKARSASRKKKKPPLNQGREKESLPHLKKEICEGGIFRQLKVKGQTCTTDKGKDRKGIRLKARRPCPRNSTKLGCPSRKGKYVHDLAEGLREGGWRDWEERTLLFFEET